MEEILTFLDDVLHNNNRPWFQEHKKQYQQAQANFNALAEQIIAGVQKFDDNCKGLTLKDCTYRFYRDTRFSPDKRPYKTHFGVFLPASLLLMPHFGNHGLWVAFLLFMVARGLSMTLMAKKAVFGSQ